MAWFRNTETDTEFSMDERWAAHVRGSAGIVELSGPGGVASSAPASTVRDNDPALQELRKADLQALCADRGLDTTGSKADLIARLGASQ